MPRGDVGELMIKGPIVMLGYYGNEAATRETVEPDGWLHTGDLGTMDEHGCVFIVDRKKDMINRPGSRSFRPRSSASSRQRSSVALVAVSSQPDELKGQIRPRPTLS